MLKGVASVLLSTVSQARMEKDSLNLTSQGILPWMYIKPWAKPRSKATKQCDCQRRAETAKLNRRESTWICFPNKEPVLFLVSMSKGHLFTHLPSPVSSYTLENQGGIILIIQWYLIASMKQSQTPQKSNQMYFKRIWKVPLEFNHRLSVMRKKPFSICCYSEFS